MKNPSAEILATAVEMRSSGEKWPAILAATGLSHSQAEIAVLKATLPKSAFKPFSPEAVLELRGEGVSWGEIGVRLSVPESTVRSAYKKATGKLSEGQRIGRGGRYLNADAELYADVLQPTGTVIPEEYGRRNARLAAFQQRLLKMEFADLKAYAADQGVTVKKGMTKARIVKAIEAQIGTEVEPAGTKAS